jgi:hypothetical protein
MCKIYEFATERKIENCIDCKDYHCKKFLDWYNPGIGFFRSSVARVGSLFLRKKLGNKKWREMLIEYEAASLD